MTSEQTASINAMCPATKTHSPVGTVHLSINAHFNDNPEELVGIWTQLGIGPITLVVAGGPPISVYAWVRTA